MISRKAFIGTTSLIGTSSLAAFTALATDTALAAKDKSSGIPAFSFDEAGFKTILASPAKHRMCFGCTYTGDGVVLDLMDNLINAYQQPSSEPTSIHTIAVLYHGASFIMALDDTFWRDVLSPFVKAGGSERARLWGAVSRNPNGNPYLSDPKSTTTITSLAARGAHFFVCNNALSDNVADIASSMGWNPAQIYQKALAALVPSALIVPAGVMAICAAQEAGYAYLQATLS